MPSTQQKPPYSILYLDHAPIWGGAEAVLVTLLNNLDRELLQPFVATNSNSPLAQRLVNSNIPSFDIPFGTLNQVSWRLPLNLTQSIKSVVQLINQHSIALVHTNTVRAHIVGTLAGWLTNTPVVWTLHDNTFPTQLVRWLAPIPRKIITVSSWLAKWYEPYGLANKLIVIPNGLNLKTPQDNAPSIRTEFNIPQNAPIVLNVGRLVEGKAPHLIIEAVERVIKIHPNAQFIMVGGADNDKLTSRTNAYAKHLDQTLSNNTHLKDHLLFVGQRQDVERFYQKADIFVYNAICPEGLPTVLLEAMAYAIPVASTAIGGALEIVQNNKTGLLFPPNDPKEISKAINTLLSNPDFAKEMGNAGLYRLRRTFTIPHQVQKTKDVYLTILQGT